MDKKISKKTQDKMRENFRKSGLSENEINKLMEIQDNLLAGSSIKVRRIKFDGTTMTTYFPSIQFKKSKAKDSLHKNKLTNPMMRFKEEWDKTQRPVFDKMVKKYAELESVSQETIMRFLK